MSKTSSSRKYLAIVAIVTAVLLLAIAFNHEPGPDCILVINEAVEEHEGITWKITNSIEGSHVHAELIISETGNLRGDSPSEQKLSMGESGSANLLGNLFPNSLLALAKEQNVTEMGGGTYGNVFDVKLNVKTNDKFNLHKGDELPICSYRLGEGGDATSVTMVFRVF